MENLFDKDVAVEFYENRYEDGYMEDWDAAKKNKIRELIDLLELPVKGRALDFGCGNGVFTRILKDALPNWEVYGVEISSVAVKNASIKNPDCKFFNSTEASDYKGQFDLLFSHHVIEHVQDLRETFSIINAYLKQNAYQFHVLPCGNEGSYEYNICMLKPDGIGSNNLFFFEEPGHLRRLSSQEFAEHERAIGFHLKKQFFANQRDGAVDWITKSSPRFVKRLTNNSGIVDPVKSEEMKTLRKKLLPLTYLQFPYSKYLGLKSKWNKNLKDRTVLAALFIPAMISRPFYQSVQQKANEEWNQRKSEINGSEMFLFFNR